MAWFVILFLSLSIACGEKDEIEYQTGYPTKMAGNWYVFDFQGRFVTIDSLNQIDFEEPDKVDGAFYLSTALDPSDNGFLVIQNIYNNNLRVKAKMDSNRFFVNYGEQLEKIKISGDTISFITLEGYVFEASEGDRIVMTIGLYDKRKLFYDSIVTYGFRKTGWEDFQLE